MEIEKVPWVTQLCFEIGGEIGGLPAVPDSVVFHEAAVGLHGEEAGWPTFGGLTAGEVLLEGASGRPRG